MSKIQVYIVLGVSLILSSCSEQISCTQEGGYWYSDGEECRVFTQITTQSDIDNDEVDDITDLLEGAYAEIQNKTHYKSAYYAGGYPPENEGVCTDVIWRALKNMGIDIKDLLDKDIAQKPGKYPGVSMNPDTNIDFRRVPNIDTFLQTHADSLDLTLNIHDTETLRNWQGGDIIVFAHPNQHIAIVSRVRDKQGVPYLLHNYADIPREDNRIFYTDMKKFPIVGHYRLTYGRGIWGKSSY